jgi:hypothetical protein
MRMILVVWLLAMGFVFGSAIHEAHVDYQIYQAEYEADVVEGNQL